MSNHISVLPWPLCASQSAHASQPTYACQPVSTCQHISDASVCLNPQCDAHDHAMSLCLEFLFMSRRQWNNPIRLSHTLHVIRVHMSCTTHSCHMPAMRHHIWVSPPWSNTKPWKCTHGKSSHCTRHYAFVPSHLMCVIAESCAIVSQIASRLMTLCSCVDASKTYMHALFMSEIPHHVPLVWRSSSHVAFFDLSHATC